MCWHCYDDWGCHGWHHYPGYYGPRGRYYEEPTPEDRRESLEDEKSFLEKRIKEIEARIAEGTK